MSGMDLFTAINNIDDKYIEEALTVSKKSIWKILVSTAACICVAVAAIIALTATGQNKKPDDTYSDYDPLAVIRMIEYNEAYYEIVGSKSIREINGLPADLTSACAGEHIAYLKGTDLLTVSVTPTDIELYSYSSNPCKAVMVVREKDKYSIALFGNYISHDGNVEMPFSELYDIFGIDSAEDITYIAKSTWDKKTLEKKVTDRTKIKRFFDITVSLEAYCNDEYQTAIFGGKSEDEQQRISIDMADNAEYLCIETVDGLKFWLTIYEEQGWMYAFLTSYKMTDEMHRWYEENIS